MTTKTRLEKLEKSNPAEPETYKLFYSLENNLFQDIITGKTCTREYLESLGNRIINLFWADERI